MKWNTGMARITAFRQALAILGTRSQMAVVLSTQLVHFAAPGFAAEDLLSEAAESDISPDGKGGRELRYLERSEGFEAALEIEYENRSVVIEPEDVDDESESSGGLSRARQAVTTTSSVELVGGYNFSRHTQAQLGIRFSDIRPHGYLEPSADHVSEWDSISPGCKRECHAARIPGYDSDGTRFQTNLPGGGTNGSME